MNWPLAGDPVDCLFEPVLPVGTADTLRALAIPTAYCASAHSILTACQLSDVVVQLEVL